MPVEILYNVRMGTSEGRNYIFRPREYGEIRSIEIYALIPVNMTQHNQTICASTFRPLIRSEMDY